MGGLPIKYIKKYGISKKAWDAFHADQKGGDRYAVASIKPKKAEKMGKKKTTKRRASPTRKAPRRKGGMGINLKEIAMTTLMLGVGKVAVSNLAPGLPFQRPLSAVAGGALATITGMPGKRLIQYGIADAGSDIAVDLVNGSGFNLGGLTGTSNKGYDM